MSAGRLERPRVAAIGHYIAVTCSNALTTAADRGTGPSRDIASNLLLMISHMTFFVIKIAETSVLNQPSSSTPVKRAGCTETSHYLKAAAP